MNLKSLQLSKRQIDGDEPAYEAWQAVLDHLYGDKPKNAAERVRRLPRPWRAVYTTISLEAEVCNGGHHQFFWNSDGEFNSETLEDLRLIDAKPFVLLFKKALSIYKRHDYAGEKRRSNNSWESFTKGSRELRMDHLDNAFFKLRKTLANYVSHYIRNNRELFELIPQVTVSPVNAKHETRKRARRSASPSTARVRNTARSPSATATRGSSSGSTKRR